MSHHDEFFDDDGDLSGQDGSVRDGQGGDQDGSSEHSIKRTSKYRGVSRALSEKKWRAQVTWNGKTLYLGTFNTEDEAARAYDQRVVTLRGKRAKTNFDISNYQAEIQWNEMHHPLREGTLVGYKVCPAESIEYWPGMMASQDDASIYMLSLRHGDRTSLLLYLFGYHKYVWTCQDEVRSFTDAFPNFDPPAHANTLHELALIEARQQGGLLAQGTLYPGTAARLTALRIFASQLLDLERRLSDYGRTCAQAFTTATRELLSIWREEVRAATSYRVLCDRLMVLESDLKEKVCTPWWSQQRVKWLTRAKAAQALWTSEQVLVELDREGISWDAIIRGDHPSAPLSALGPGTSTTPALALPPARVSSPSSSGHGATTGTSVAVEDVTMSQDIPVAVFASSALR